MASIWLFEVMLCWSVSGYLKKCRRYKVCILLSNWALQSERYNRQQCHSLYGKQSGYKKYILYSNTSSHVMFSKCIHTPLQPNCNSMSASVIGGQRHYSAVPSVSMKRVLLVSKVTRYELECQRYPDLGALKLEDTLRKQCFDYDVLLHHHNLHKEFEHNVRQILNDCGIETRTVNRWGIKLNVFIFVSV